MRYLYKQSRMAKRRQRLRMTAQAGLIVAAVLAWSGAAGGTFDVTVRNGFVTLDAQAAPLGEVLRQLSEKAGFKLVMKQDLRAPVTWRFEDVPVDEAVTRLLARVSSIAIYAPADEGGVRSALAEVRVLRGGNDTVPLVEHRTEFAAGAGPDDSPEAGQLAEAEPESPTGEQLASAGTADIQPAARTPGRISRALEDADPATRRDAALKASKLRPDMARNALTEALSNSDAVVRQRAVQGLARLGGEETVASLSRILLEDPEPRVRRMAAAGLGRISTESAFWALMEANSDENQGVREAVGAALVALERRGIGARTEGPAQ